MILICKHVPTETLGYLHNPGSLRNMSEMYHYGMHAL